MSVILMKEWDEIKPRLPKPLRNRLTEDFGHNPFIHSPEGLTGYAIMTSIQLNGNDDLASELLQWAMANRM